MYYILDLRTNPPSEVPNLFFLSEDDAIIWIDKNGDATIYTIIYYK